MTRFTRLLFAALLLGTFPGLAQDSTPAPRPYLLDVCVVSGRAVPADATTITIAGTNDPSMDGRTLRVCCNGCTGKVNNDPARYLAKLDELMIQEQSPRYPLNVCLVQGSNPLSESGPKKPFQAIHGNRLIRTCCGGCFKTFQKDPATYIARLDKAAIEAQSKDYPLTVCILSGRDLGENPTTFLLGDRLVKTCCGGCRKNVLSDPHTYMRKIDAARNAAQPASTPTSVATPDRSTLIDGVPTAVHGAITKRYPAAKVVASVLDDGVWEVRILTDQGAKRQLEISPDGWILDDKARN